MGWNVKTDIGGQEVYTSIYSDYFHWLHLWNTSTEDIKFKKDLNVANYLSYFKKSISCPVDEVHKN